MTYPIYYVDDGLSIALLETINRIGCLLVREDRLYKRGEFTLGNRAADQALPRLLVRVSDDRWTGGVVHILCRIKVRQW